MQIFNETPFAAALLESPNPRGGGVTLVVKGAFAIVDGARATVLPKRSPTDGEHEGPPRELSGELDWRTGPLGVCRYPSDFVPFKAATDVVAVATVTGGSGETRRIQLRAGKLIKIIEHSRGAAKQLASLAPLAGPNAERLAASGTYDERWRATRWPWFPEDFDWSTFQAAPTDQRVAGYLKGDELLQLDGHAERAVKTFLPGLRPRAFLRGARPDERLIHEFPLVLDTVWLDADAGALVLVWRGHVAGLRPLEATSALVAVESMSDPPARRRAFEDEARWHPTKTAEVDDADADLDGDDWMTVALEPKEPITKPDEEEAKDIANAIELMREARLPDDLVAKAALAPTLASLVALLDATLPTFETTSVDETRSLERAKELLRSHGHDPSLLDESPPDPEPDATTGRPWTRDDVIARAKAGEPLSDADLRGLDLTGADLKGARLDGARLDGAKLDRANMSDADLSGATLRNASAEGACFDRILAEGAGLESLAAKQASFVGANLAGAKLSYALLTGANFAEADLSRANLAGALLAEASLIAAELDAAELQLAVLCDSDATGCSLRQCNLTGVNLTGAILDGANLGQATLDRVKLDAASLVDARLEGAHGEHVSLERATMTRLRAGRDCSFRGANLRETRGDDANFSSADLSGATFDGATLTRALFRGASLEGASLHLCVLKQTDFSDALLAGARLTKVNAFQGRFPNADLGEADCRGSNFYESEFWQANTRGARFDRSILAGTKLEPEAMT